MAKKKKNDEFSFEFVQNYLLKRITELGLSNNPTATVITKDEEDTLRVAFDRNGYKVQIDCTSILIINFVPYFIYDNSETEFDLFDVFNALDINDFTDYGFVSSEDDEDEQKKTINEMLELIIRYDYDIRKAGEEEYLSNMEEMHIAEKKIYSSGELKIKEIIRVNRLETKMKKTKSDKDKKAFIDALKAREDKGLLTTYDKRFISYLEQGYPIPDADEEDDSYIGYAKLKFIATAICCAVGFAVCLGIACADKLIIGVQGLYLFNSENIIFSLIAGVPLSYFLCEVLSKPIAVKLATEDKKECVKKEFDKKYANFGFIKKIMSKYISNAIALIGAVFFIFIACSGVCFTENSVINHSLFINDEIQYEDVQISLVKGWSDEAGYYEYDNPCYRIEYGEMSFETGELDDEKIADVNSIFENHGINPIEVKE